MKIKRIRHLNCQIIEELEYKPGTVTVFSGRNKSGKSSAIKGILSVLRGGSDPDSIRRGEKRSEVEITLLESEPTGDREYVVTKKQTRKGATLTVTRNGVELESPKKVVEELFHVGGADPGKFLAGNDAARLRMLLDAADLQLPVAAEEAAAGLLRKYQDGARSPLDIIDAVEKELVSDRRAVNRLVKAKSEAVAELARNVTPGGDPEDAERVTAERDDAREKLGGMSSATLEASKEAGRIGAVRLVEIKQEINALEDEARENEAVRVKAVEAVQFEVEAASAELVALIGRLDGELQRAAARAMLEDGIERVGDELKAVEAEGEGLEARIEKLRDARKQCFDGLPIDGLEVFDGVISYEGVRWDHLNTATQISIVFKLLELGCPEGKLLVICSDALNHLDDDTRAAFFAAVEDKKDVYFFLESVSDGPLAVGDGKETSPVAEVPRNG